MLVMFFFPKVCLLGFNVFAFEKAAIARSSINLVVLCEVAYENMLK